MLQRFVCGFYRKFLCFFIFNVLILKVVKCQSCVDSASRSGTCVALDKCPSMVVEYYDEARKSSHGIDFPTFVSNNICSFDGKTFMVCCRTPSLNPSKTKLPITNYPNRPIVFGQAQQTPTLPARPATFPPASTATASASNVFLFAPLGGSSIIPQAPQPPITYTTPTTLTPWNNWSSAVYPPTTGVTSGGAVSTNVYPNSLIFQPSAQSPPITAPSMTFQPSQTIPAATAGANVLQPVPLPGQVITTPTAGGGGLISQTVSQPVIASTTAAPIPAPQVVPSAGTCGITRATTNRVVGGTEAKRGAYPWIAALGYRDEVDQTTLKFLCGGSLISLTYVITSAHCINPNLILVRLGAHDITNPSDPNARDYRIKRSVTHEAFDLKSISNDIALIELSQAVTVTNFIRPICLPESSTFLNQEFVGMNPFIAGWGAIKYQGATSNVLLDAQVPIVSRQSCEQSYRSIFNFVQFSDKLICAGNSNVDACQGDSGGPLMLPQMIGGAYYYYLIGVVSYGYECARAGFPGVYTRVAAFMPWIKRHMT